MSFQLNSLEKYVCSSCGQEHYSWPALAYSSPIQYYDLSDTEKENIGELTSDICIIKHPEQIDRFIRCTLTLKVTDHCEDLDYGLWVSVSEKSFIDYTENYDNPNHDAKYFGWLSNMPGYDFTESIPTTVFTRRDGNRPEIVPHKNFDHPFVRDYYNGISKENAEQRISEMFKNIEHSDQ